MPSPDRRSNPRYPLAIPVRIRAFDSARGEHEEVSAQSTNVSCSGLFITSPQKLPVGSALSMTLRIPTEISGSAFTGVRCMGRVVHEHPSDDGQTGYGIAIERRAPHVGSSLPSKPIPEAPSASSQSGAPF
ncbi:MAG TPA: PilZ domain-containing protein [Candidatus Methylomirabilis sp.]|nr:PilZ domain-containing protein [Candidatus Methylomirabilis sp.]